MSKSPAGNQSTASSLQPYRDGWSALSQLIGEGKSFSGHERNCFFLNTRDGQFVDGSAALGLNLDDDARAVGVTDWDFDGTPDFWVTNRTAPRVRLLKNRCGTNNFLWLKMQGVTSNRDAIGTRVEVQLRSDPKSQIRTVRAGDGFLAQSTKWLHFGLGKNRVIERVAIRWPSGTLQVLTGLAANTRYVIREHDATPTVWKPPAIRQFASQPREVPRTTETRTWILGRLPLPHTNYRDRSGGVMDAGAYRSLPLLVNLWSIDCVPCLQELQTWADAHDQIKPRCRVLALNVDELGDVDSDSIRAVVDKLGLPFEVAFATPELVDGIEVLQRTFIELQQPLPVPSSLLLDEQGRVAAIYKGRLPIDTLLRDIELLRAPLDEQRKQAVPFSGRFASDVFPVDPRPLAQTLIMDDRQTEAIAYLQQFAAGIDVTASVRNFEAEVSANRMLVQLLLQSRRIDDAVPVLASLRVTAQNDETLHRQLAMQLLQAARPAIALEHFRLAIGLADARMGNGDAILLFNGGLAAMAAGHSVVAEAWLERASEFAADADSFYHLGNARYANGKSLEALKAYLQALKIRPGWLLAANNAAWILATAAEDHVRDGAAAVQLIQSLSASKRQADPALLSTLAAAYAEVSRFEDAVEMNERAMDIFRQRNERQQAERLSARSKLFRQRRPYRDRTQ